MDYAAERQRLVEWMRKQLIGPAMDGALRGISPLQRYPMGVLYPTVETGEGLDPASEEDDAAQDDVAGPVEGDTEATAEGIVRRRYIPPSSVGFSFYVHGTDWAIQVLFSAVIYRERREQGRFTKAYERIPLGGDKDALQINRAGRHLVLRHRDDDGEERNTAGLDVHTRRHGEGTIVTLSLFNNKQMPADLGPGGWHDEQLKRSLFEVALACVIDKGVVGSYPRVEFSLLDDEDQELELQYKSRKIYAVGHGCAVDWHVGENGVHEIRSQFMPAVEVPQVTADVAGGDRVFNLAYLAEIAQNRAAICDELRRFAGRYGDWVADRERELAQLAADERNAGERIVSRMGHALKRMQGGISLIEKDAMVARAFALANQAMLDQMQQTNRNKGQATDLSRMNWRPFQLAFLLTTLESAIDADDDFRDTVDLIWFPTGGGKTEAYLGLIAMVMLWRRFKFPESGGGTTSFLCATPCGC
jgi:hypothetical protein